MKEKLDQVIELLTALRDGKTLQYQYKTFKDEIKTIEGLSLAELYDNPERYRIKPEPREWWIIMRKTDGHFYSVFRSKESAVYYSDSNYTIDEKKVREIIHVKEVL